MQNFDFATAARVVFGAGKLQEAVGAAREFGSRVLLVSGASPDRANRLTAMLRGAGAEVSLFSVKGEPTIESVRQGVEAARESGSDVVIAIGGGSPIDAGKAIASLLANGGDPLDYLEVVGKALPIRLPSLPFLAIPTTAGAGAEVTRNAVLAVPEHRVKASLRSPHLLARVAIVDPELSAGMPKSVTAATGMDALTQLIEPYVSIRANPMTDILCLDGMRRVASSLERAYCSPADLSARESMAMASLLGGMALANAGLGIVHGFAAPVGGMFPAPHGAVCAALLAPAMRVNLSALGSRSPHSQALERYDAVARILTGNPHASASDGVRYVEELAQRLEIPPLRTYGIEERHVPDLVEKAKQASSTKGNPIALTADELTEILTAAR
jgi:alcohol dehydrogenase class IV